MKPFAILLCAAAATASPLIITPGDLFLSVPNATLYGSMFAPGFFGSLNGVASDLMEFSSIPLTGAPSVAAATSGLFSNLSVMPLLLSKTSPSPNFSVVLQDSRTSLGNVSAIFSIPGATIPAIASGITLTPDVQALIPFEVTALSLAGTTPVTVNYGAAGSKLFNLALTLDPAAGVSAGTLRLVRDSESGGFFTPGGLTNMTAYATLTFSSGSESYATSRRLRSDSGSGSFSVLSESTTVPEPATAGLLFGGFTLIGVAAVFTRRHGPTADA